MSEQRFTVAEAAAACGKSKETVTWRLKKKQFPGAKKVGNRWTIPVEDLLAVGWQPTDSQTDQLHREVVDLRAKNERLTVELDLAKDKIITLLEQLDERQPKQIESPLGFLKRVLVG